MRAVQGAILLAALLEVIIGMTGLIGFLLRWITPLTIGPTIAQLGLSLFKVAGEKAGKSWLISGLLVLKLFENYNN